MFTKSVAWYDALNSWKDYKRESQRLRLLIEEHAQRPITTLLDVACGTGLHLTHLKDYYAVEGLDLNPEMLSLARQRHPSVAFHERVMREFNLGRRFDVVTCLFASVSYCRSMPELEQTIKCMARHANPGGLVIVEPFLTPEQIKPGYVSAIFVDRPDLKIARIHTSEMANGMATMPFHYLVGTPEGVQHFTERHEFSLFSHEQYLTGFKAAGLHAVHDAEGLMGRGLYIGVKSSRGQLSKKDCQLSSRKRPSRPQLTLTQANPHRDQSLCDHSLRERGHATARSHDLRGEYPAY